MTQKYIRKIDKVPSVLYDVPGVGGVWPGDVCGGGDHLLQEQGGGPSQANIHVILYTLPTTLAKDIIPAS